MSPLSYRADIDGLRALAVLPVVLYHAGVPGFSGGYIGVDVFFVISGYLITTIIQREIEQDSFSLARFYERRARRILPALCVVLAATLVVSVFVLLPGDMEALGKTALASLGFMSNIWFWYADGPSYFAPASELQPLLHTWSLALEEQFYILFPLLLMALHKFARHRMRSVVLALVVVSFTASVWAVPRDPVAAFFLLPTRIWELGFGSCLALGLPAMRATRLQREAVGALGLLAIVLPVLIFNSSTPFPGLGALAPVAGAAALIWTGGAGGSLVSWILTWRPLVFIGLVSYSFYLWHWPVMSLLRHWQVGLDFTWPAEIATVALSFSLAVLTWRFVERPFRKPASLRRGSLRALMVSAGTLLVLALGAGGVVASNGVTQRFTQADLDWLETGSGKGPKADACAGRTIEQGLCRSGASHVQPSVLLWGDSHALAARGAIGETVSAANRAMLFAGNHACAPLPGLRRLPATSQNKACGTNNEDVLEMLLDQPGLGTVILHARWALYTNGSFLREESRPDVRLISAEAAQAGTETSQDDMVLEELRSLITTLRAAHKQVILLGPVPEHGRNPRLLTIRARLFDRPPASGLSRAEVDDRQGQSDAILRQVAEETGALYLPITPEMCGETCPSRDGKTVFYADDDHLSNAGARRFVSPLLRDHIVPAGG